MTVFMSQIPCGLGAFCEDVWQVLAAYIKALRLQPMQEAALMVYKSPNQELLTKSKYAQTKQQK